MRVYRFLLAVALACPLVALAQEPGSNVVTNEAFTFTVAQEPDGNLALTVINTDISEPPPVTGISDNENRFNPYYLAAAIAALLGSGGTAYVVKRKKETA